MLLFATPAILLLQTRDVSAETGPLTGDTSSAVGPVPSLAANLLCLDVVIVTLVMELLRELGT